MKKKLKSQKQVVISSDITYTSNETLFSWILSLGKTGIKNLPQMAKTSAIQIGVVFLFQLIFWWNEISRYIPDIIKVPVIFLTATYNDIIPKTLYWIIIFTFGKRLFFKIKNTGFKKAISPILSIVPEIKRVYRYLRTKAYSLLLIGSGIGLVIANNFASYSRFSGARNKFDKYFIALVISFTISYLLGEGRKHWIFKFNRLFFADISKLFKFKINYTDNHTYILLSGIILGLLLDAPLIIMKLKYGGYITGGIFFLSGIVLSIIYHFKRGKI